MIGALADRAPWYVVGLALGLVVVGLLITLNQRTGAVGGFSDIVERLTGRATGLGSRGWFLLGVVGGSAVFVLLGGSNGAAPGYGWLTRTFTGDWQLLVGPVLFAAGGLIGYGAKTAGGCTSGNGLCGSSLGSPASLTATATFMITAVVVTFALSAVL